MGKGSKRRPQDVDDETMRENWERIFGAAGSRPAGELDIVRRSAAGSRPATGVPEPILIHRGNPSTD